MAQSKRELSWETANVVLNSLPGETSVGLIVGLRRSRGRRPNEKKTAATFQTLADRVSDRLHEPPEILKPIENLQTCLIKGSVRWALAFLQQPEIIMVVSAGNSPVTISAKQPTVTPSPLPRSCPPGSSSVRRTRATPTRAPRGAVARVEPGKTPTPAKRTRAATNQR